MAIGLKFANDTQPQIANAYKQVLKLFQSDKSLRIANRIYYKRGYEILPTFLKIARCKFFSAAVPLNFAHSTVSANLINKWVAQQTDNKIRDLIASGSLTENTRLVLVNAVYFKNAWKTKFDKANTKNDKFYTKTHKSTDVEMMHVKVCWGFSIFNHFFKLNLHKHTGKIQLWLLCNIKIMYP